MRKTEGAALAGVSVERMRVDRHSKSTAAERNCAECLLGLKLPSFVIVNAHRVELTYTL
ncbi:MAG: hypothetical protein VX083_09405 [Pseudomonadota bacterium]|jgi:hypothetical protein|nr:hypothetical protein [Pseudomonadota bacterium]MEC8039929.1 hypothetical protein [Pseudomonadota bacterium]MEC8293700.1 hypothetical protein [Pseudomonadota bacterium]